MHAASIRNASLVVRSGDAEGPSNIQSLTTGDVNQTNGTAMEIFMEGDHLPDIRM